MKRHYFKCKVCGDSLTVTGRTPVQAVACAVKLGWVIGKKYICPDCIDPIKNDEDSNDDMEETK